MSGEKLSKERMKKLINCIMMRRHLWDTEDCHYKDKRMAAKAWNEVAEEMQMPMQMVRMKWKNMRDMFNRELRRMPGPVTCPEDYRGRWRYFKSLWFLLRPCQKMETQYLDEVMDQTYDDDDDDNKAFIIKVGPDYLSNSTVHDTLSDRVDDDEFDYDTRETKAKKIKHSDGDDDDYDIMFLKSLAPYMRSLSPVRKLEVRNQIQEIFLEKIKK